MTNMKTIVRDDFFCMVPFPLSIKALTYASGAEGGGMQRDMAFEQMSNPPHPLSASEIKQTFHQPCLFIGF